ncbi:response regulator [Halorubrum sp. SD626R]|uniref:GAF domain-containing protein n=1 Tax=Halorubrum sp. SD626R TaxID=1419722 RepID=UPI0010F5F601|nr:GAF domain-containing protein [Halorubrum sp. SD626R]TKX81025.1 response regulator [Halorubrum sp. SD626R]
MDTASGDAASGTGGDCPDADAFRGSDPAGGGPRRVLFVDDEPGAADLAATHVERLVEGIETVTFTAPDDALAAVETERVDCVVSDFDMPGSDGLELLTDIRDVDPGIPFVLFTGKGSEEIASEAISAGVTDYLQKGAGRDRYEMLANSVVNALERRRAERDLREVNAKVTALHEFATDVAACERVDDVFERTVAAAESVLEFDRCVTARREGDLLVPAALSESVTDDEVRAFEVGQGVAGTTAAEGRTMVVDNVSVDPADPDQLEDPENCDRPGADPSGDPDRLDGSDPLDDPDRADGSAVAEPVVDDVRSAISVPIGSYGVLQALSDGYAAFDDGDVEFAELLAAHAADAIEQIETENALRAERDRLTALFDDLPLPAARTVALGDGERRLDATNEAFERTFGYSTADHGYREIREGIIPEDADPPDPETILDAEETPRLEVRRRTTDGLRDFILHVIPVRRPVETVVYSVYADIGEQKRVERTLRRLHETTREMFRGEDREEIAELATRAAIDILEFPSSGVRLYDPDAGKLLPTAISEEATAALGERPAFGPGDGRVWEAFETGELIRVDDLDDVDTSVGYGDHRSLLVVPLGDHGVMPLGSVEPGFFDDTATQLARVLAANVTVALDGAERTAQLRDRDDALQREIDRLEKFAGLVSHDLRSPLNVADGRLELAREFVDDPDALDEIDRVGDAHDRMSQLIDDLLALARQGRTVDDLESVDLAEAAATAWRTVDTAGATLDAPDGSVTVDADPERLRTLLENLFANSVEHGSTNSRAEPDDSVEHGSTDSRTKSGDSMEHGSTSGRAQPDDDPADAGPGVTVTVAALPDGFAVADDGDGFDIDPEEALEYGTSNDPRGTGFGLAIVREIAAAHGWTLSVDDADGARFEFRTDG